MSIVETRLIKSAYGFNIKIKKALPKKQKLYNLLLDYIGKKQGYQLKLTYIN